MLIRFLFVVFKTFSPLRQLACTTREIKVTEMLCCIFSVSEQSVSRYKWRLDLSLCSVLFWINSVLKYLQLFKKNWCNRSCVAIMLQVSTDLRFAARNLQTIIDQLYLQLNSNFLEVLLIQRSQWKPVSHLDLVTSFNRAASNVSPNAIITLLRK